MGILDLVDPTGQRLSGESLASLRFLGNKNASIFASLGSLLARTSGSRPVSTRNQTNKKYPAGICYLFGGSYWARTSDLANVNRTL